MKIPLAILMLVSASLASAAEPGFTKQYVHCRDNDESGAPMERIDCMAAETKRQGAMLESAYNAVLKETPKAGQARLREAQRDWLKFMNTNCGVFHDAGEQIGGMLAREEARAECVMNMTRDRKLNLKELLDLRNS